MKKTFSFILTLIMSFTCLFQAGVSYADTRPHVEDALKALQTQAGYIPGQYSSVQGNCFGFVSDVCSKLYGVTYYNEQQVGNYQFNHTGNYYTVAETVIPYSSVSSQQSANAAALRDWLLANAAVGDVLQYGSADSGYSKKHTVLIQHIDEEKLQVYHSNYATSGIPSSACRVDTLYWSSFVSSPLANAKDSSGNITSLNYLFGSSLKLTQGMGISINRYSFLEQKYQLDSLSKYTSEITKTERSSSTSIKIYWKAIDDASAYKLEYKTADETEWTTASDAITATDYTVKKLTPGVTYCFRVSALVLGEWKDYSTEATKSVLPPKPANVGAAAADGCIQISWVARSDITGVLIYRSTEKSGEYSVIANVPKEYTTYDDRSISNNTTYYYKVQRYYIDSSQSTYLSEMSAAKSAVYELSVTSVKAYPETKSSATIKWSGDENATSYTVAYRKKGSKSYKYITTDDTEKLVKGLNLNSTYTFYVQANNDYGSSSMTASQSLKVKPKKPVVTVKKKGKSAKISWSKVSGVSGYKIYRSYSKNGKKTLVKTIKGNKKFSYTDKKVYKNQKYYYTVKSYVTKNKKQYDGYASSAKKVKI